MVSVPSFILKKLYVKGSLKNKEDGYRFELKNTLAEATVITPVKLNVDGRDIDTRNISLDNGKEKLVSAEISQSKPVKFMVGTSIIVEVKDRQLQQGQHRIDIRAGSKEFGELSFSVQDSVQ
ncbi:MAG: hydroxymethylglutaryl-CoA reductase [Thermoplasmata archaeon]